MDSNARSLNNHRVIEEFLSATDEEDDPVSNFIKATLAQFLLNLRRELTSKAQDGYITTNDIIDTQINQLRGCVLDLERCKFLVNSKGNYQ